VAWPLPEGLLDRGPEATVRFTYRDGRPLRDVDGGTDGRRIGLPPDEPLPALASRAFLAAEDRRHGLHPGVDPIAVVRAAGRNLRAGRIVGGGSTIAQQLARLLVPRPRTVAGKVQEALWAMRITLHLPPETRLRAYLDRIALGNGLRGVESASQAYFGRPAAALSLGQAALLAGMAGSPARFDPRVHPEAAAARMRMVLGRMVRSGSATEAESRAAAEAPLDLVAPVRPFGAPHLTTWLAAHRDTLGLARAVAVETTLDEALQADVEEILREQVGGDPRVEQAATIVLDNATGEVLAYAGSAGFFDEERQGQNDGVRSSRQPGSALKPFAYGLALADGLTPATLLSDVEVHLATPSGSWIPRNYDRRVHGPVRLRAALANSYNVPAVRLAERLGPDRVLSVLRRAGFESLREGSDHYGAGIVLGNGDVTLRELARAYRGLARGGRVEPVTEVRDARDAGGRPVVPRRDLAPRRFLPADAVALLTDILSDERARAPAFGLDNALRLPFPVAAKTGTSHAFVDNWTVGFTAERTVAVWAGNFDGRPMHGVSGISGAAPIFSRVMVRAMRGITPAPLLERSAFQAARVCALSGGLAGPACPSAVDEVFLPGTAPSGACPMHRHHGPGGLDVGPEFYAWAAGEGIDGGPRTDSPGVVAAGPGQIVLPADGDEYLLDGGLEDGAQAIPVRVRPPPGASRVELRTGDGAVLSLEAPFAGRLPARPGRHRVELWTPGGTAPLAVSVFVVRGGAP
jgi:penicillin-binding protein 1C